MEQYPELPKLQLYSLKSRFSAGLAIKTGKNATSAAKAAGKVAFGAAMVAILALYHQGMTTVGLKVRASSGVIWA